MTTEVRVGREIFSEKIHYNQFIKIINDLNNLFSMFHGDNV